VTCNFASNEYNAERQRKGVGAADGRHEFAAGIGIAVEERIAVRRQWHAGSVRVPGSGAVWFAFWRFRKNAAVLRVLVVIAMLDGHHVLMTGCGGFSLNSAKPGNYVIQVTATGEQTGVTHVANSR